MHVANRELSQELWELSGWESENTWAEPSQGESGPLVVDSASTYLGHDIHRVAYAYDLGYLMRKLHENWKDTGFVRLTVNKGGHTAEVFNLYKSPSSLRLQRTPEDAICRACIELFKQGILTKEAA